MFGFWLWQQSARGFGLTRCDDMQFGRQAPTLQYASRKLPTVYVQFCQQTLTHADSSCQSVRQSARPSHIQALQLNAVRLRMQKKSFSEISVYLNDLKRLQARQDFIEFCRRETFNIYVYVVICFHVRCLGFLNVTIRWHSVSECIRVSKPEHIQHRHNCTLRHIQSYS